MISWSKGKFLFFCALLVALGPSVASAQPCPETETSVFTINSSNGDFLRVNFDFNCVEVLNDDANEIVNPRDLVVLPSDGGGVDVVIAADDRLCVYRDALDDNAPRRCSDIIPIGTIPRSVSVTVLSGGDLVVANSGPGDSTGQQEILWRVRKDAQSPTGFTFDSTPVDDNIPCDRLEQIKSVPFNQDPLGVDDIFATCEIPAQVFLYQRNAMTDSWTRTTFGPIQFNDGGPTGVAFGPEQNVIIAEATGRIRKFDSNGGDQGIFSNELGNGPVRLAAGPFVAVNETISALFATQLNTGSIHIFDALTGARETVTSSIQSPSGTDCTVCRAVPVAAAGDVVSPTESLESQYEIVAVPGYVDARVILLPDNGSRFLDDIGSLAGLSGLPRIFIPEHVQSLPRLLDNGDVQNTWFILQLTGTIGIAPGTVLHHIDENALGFQVSESCDEPFNEAPQGFYAPETQTSGSPRNEPPIIEGDVFTNWDHGCSPGHFLRGIRGSSLYLTAKESLSVDQVVDGKCVSLDGVHDPENSAPGTLAGFIHPNLNGRLRGLVADACTTADKNGRKALKIIADYLEEVQAGIPLTDNGSRNVTGELTARGKSLAATICRSFDKGNPPRECGTLLP